MPRLFTLEDPTIRVAVIVLWLLMLHALWQHFTTQAECIEPKKSYAVRA
jgi:hypothetical protein